MHRARDAEGWAYVDEHATNRLSVTLRTEQCHSSATAARVEVVVRFDQQPLGDVRRDRLRTPFGSASLT